MYRISRIFVSDIIAGDNLLRNGFIPVFREGGQADHGVLFAPNGTCKTTLLSFILSVFCPGRQRFVQHLQSGGDKSLEQYLIAGRPALVLLDLVTDLHPTLFEAKPREHLVLGQLLYRHRSMPDKTERHFFLAQSAEFFEEIRSKWDELLGLDQPYRAVRDFMLPRIQQTTSQKEWADKLERLGLDPWLIDRQVDFARTEGGIKDAFKFPSETEFLSFFLGCVTDLEAAATLRERIDQDLRKMQDRPRKLGQLKAVRNLRNRIDNFDTIASQWRSTGMAIKAWQLQLGEASHLLQEAVQAAKETARTLTPALKEAKTLHRQAADNLETARCNILAVQQFQLIRVITYREQELHLAKEEINRLHCEELAIEAADFMADIRANQAEAATKNEALSLAGKEIAPMQRRMEGLAAQYHLRLDADRHQVEKTIHSLKRQEEKLEAQLQTVEQRQSDDLARQEVLNTAFSRLDDRIRGAEARRTVLAMEPGEEPMDALARLKAENSSIHNNITRLLGEMSALDESLQTDNSSLRELQANHARTEAKLIQARERVEAETAERSRLMANSLLTRVAGTSQVEVTSAELVSRLDDTLFRTRNKLEDERRSSLELKQTLEKLDLSQTLSADDQTQRLIAHYHQSDIAAGDLKSYPEYLASLYEEPEQIAMFIEGDPARFTGIMAATETVIEKVRDLPVPSWLHRPVVISAPCPPEDITPVVHTVIGPASPEVYSKLYLAKVKARHQNELTALKLRIGKTETLLRELENTSRDLHAYREKYPDRAAVAALTERVEVIENAQAQLAEDIKEAETKAKRLGQSKIDLEGRYRLLGDETARLNQLVNPLEVWLKNYASLPQWQEEAENNRIEMANLEKSIRSHTEIQETLKEDGHRFKGDIREQNFLMKGLDERSGELLRPQEMTLTPAEHEAALSMDLKTMRRLHEAAREDLRQMTNQLGINTLRKELETLQQKIAACESQFQAFRRENPYDEQAAIDWAGRNRIQRIERLQELAYKKSELKESNIRLESEMKFQKKELTAIKADLSGRKTRGINPDLTEETIAGYDPDELLHRLQGKKRDLLTTRERLSDRCSNLEGKQKNLDIWLQEIKLGLAENQRFEAVWDETSPRHRWPDLIAGTEEADRISAIGQLRQELQQMALAEKKDRQTMEEAQRQMRSAFDRFQIDMQNEACRNELPAVVDELRSHDAESLGAQAQDLIQRCEDIARNFETDLEITQRFMDSLVDMLLQHSREYHQKLQAAAREVLPEEVFIYGGKPILRAGTRLDFAKHQDAFRQSVENWLYELMQQDRLPEANPRVGNRLGAELLYQLLGAASGRQTFGIRLLKCDDSGSRYEPVGKDLGSGGEALTIAVLLYALLISMRKKRRGSSDGRIPAFLVLDNPLGVCNRSDFLDAQLKVASGMGLQCVYLTGINDRESLDLFELRVAICKGQKKLEIDGTLYDCLEVTELNVEKQHGSRVT